MTCIVGLVDRGKVYMGADNVGSDGHRMYRRGDLKIGVNGEFVIGSCGSYRTAQLLVYKWTPPRVHEGDDLYKFMVVDVVESIRKVMAEGGAQKKKDEVVTMDGDVVFGFRGELFTVYSDYQVARHLNGYTAVGSGEDYALGSLYSTNEWKSPRERLLKALQTAEEFVSTVRGPFQFWPEPETEETSS